MYTCALHKSGNGAGELNSLGIKGRALLQSGDVDNEAKYFLQITYKIVACIFLSMAGIFGSDDLLFLFDNEHFVWSISCIFLVAKLHYSCP